MKKLIENLNQMNEFVIHWQKQKEDTEEWILILESIFEAQQNGDYILLADILECDLLPFLQKLQLDLQANRISAKDSVWRKNLDCIQKINKKLYQQIMTFCGTKLLNQTKVKYETVLAVNGQATCKAFIDGKEFYLHSMVNPMTEAELLVDNIPANSEDEYCIWGLGMGYHIKALLDKNEKNHVKVFEHQMQILCMALQYLNWQEYLMTGRLEIIYEAEITKAVQSFCEKQSGATVFMYYPSVRCIEDIRVRETLEEFFVSISGMQEQHRYLEENFAYLQKQNLPECGELYELFHRKRLAIVAGGPSVDLELENIKKYRKQISILAVGTIARKLLTNGIYPDAIIITDPLDVMYHQVEGLDTCQIPLLLLSTASKTVVPYYHGPIYLIYQQGYEPAERVAEQRGYRMFQTGGSVTTTALEIGIQFGAKEIFLIGADMAYTNHCTHAAGIGREILEKEDLRQVQAVDGGMVYTSKNLNLYRKWIERRIEGIKQPVIYNTSKGAKIAGTLENSLEEIVKKQD